MSDSKLKESALDLQRRRAAALEKVGGAYKIDRYGDLRDKNGGQ